MSAADMDYFGHNDRPPFAPETLKPVAAAVVVVAFSSVAWIQKTFKCTEPQAITLKANAQHDFEALMVAVRAAKGRRL